MLESTIIIALGSNCGSGESIEKAKSIIKEKFGEARFTPSIKTEPIGNFDTYFTNCIGTFTSCLSADEITKTLKSIEMECGDDKAIREKGRVVLDADLLLYGEKRCHVQDWDRPYIHTLLEMLNKRM